jgi:UDP-glucose 4-epimerase
VRTLMLEHLCPSPLAPVRVVVIGAGGFVGSAISGRLTSEGVDTLPLTRRELDLLTSDAAGRLTSLLRPTDSVVMVSAVAPARTIPTIAPNIQMAEVVCQALIETPVTHVVYISSDAVYADDPSPITEQSCGQPASLHGAMHVLREAMLRASVSGPLAILRPTLLYGAGDPHDGYGPNRFRRQAAMGKPVPLFGDGEERRDHVYIEDVGRLTALVLHHRSQGVLNIATGESTSFRRVAEMVAALAPKPVDIVTSARRAPVTHRHFDVTARLKAFPSFRHTPLAEGLRRASQEA